MCTWCSRMARICTGRDLEHHVHIRISEIRSEEHTSELQSLTNLVCRLLLEKKKTTTNNNLHPHRASSESAGTAAQESRAHACGRGAHQISASGRHQRQQHRRPA